MSHHQYFHCVIINLNDLNDLQNQYLTNDTNLKHNV